MTEPDPHYDLYRRSKAGEDISNEWGSHRNIEDVCWGFWRIIGAKTKHDDPVAIYGQDGYDGTIILDGVDAGKTRQTYTSNNDKAWHNFLTWRGPKAKAVTKAEWTQAVSTGFWPDKKPAREMSTDERLGVSTEAGGNDAPIEEALADQIQALAEKLAAAKEPVTQDEANALSGDLDRMRGLLKKAGAVREEEYRPHKTAADAVATKWADIMQPGLDAGEKAEARRKAFLQKQQARLNAEAAAERARLAREAEALRIQAEHDAKSKGEAPPPPETFAPPPVEEKRATAGSAHGRSTGLRKYVVAKITDLPMLVNHLIDSRSPNAEVMALVKKIADAAAKAGNPMPGTEKDEELR